MRTPSIFSPTELARIVREAEVDPAKGKRAVVGTVDQGGAQVVASFKFRNDRWTLEAAARREWTGERTIGAKVMLQW